MSFCLSVTLWILLVICVVHRVFYRLDALKKLQENQNGHILLPANPDPPGKRPFSRWTWVSRCLLKQRMVEVVVTTGAISRAKLQSNHHHRQTNTQLFTGRMPFLSPSQQCQSTEGKISHSMDLPQAHLGSSNFVSDE